MFLKEKSFSCQNYLSFTEARDEDTENNLCNLEVLWIIFLDHSDIGIVKYKEIRRSGTKLFANNTNVEEKPICDSVAKSKGQGKNNVDFQRKNKRWGHPSSIVIISTSKFISRNPT